MPASGRARSSSLKICGNRGYNLRNFSGRPRLLASGTSDHSRAKYAKHAKVTQPQTPRKFDFLTWRSLRALRETFRLFGSGVAALCTLTASTGLGAGLEL